jgi:hypothetical protein
MLSRAWAPCHGELLAQDEQEPRPTDYVRYLIHADVISTQTPYTAFLVHTTAPSRSTSIERLVVRGTTNDDIGEYRSLQNLSDG